MIERRALILGSLLFTCHLALALVLIPPWQHPDEPTHVAVVERQRHRFAADGDARQPGREAEILQSMTRHRWWEHRAVGFERPAEIPDNFVHRVGVPSESFGRPTIYYVVTGAMLSRLPMPVAGHLYVLRGLSATLGLLTLWVAWLGAREAAGALAAALVVVLVALHPHFAIASSSASPDALINFLGAVVWWQTTLALRRSRIVKPIAAMWTAALLAAVADRMGIALLAVALVATLIVVRLRVPVDTVRTFVRKPKTLALGLVACGAAAVALAAFGSNYGLGRIFSGTLAPVPGAMTPSSFIRFTWLVHASWWYSLGWGRYAPPTVWFLLATAVTIVTAAGVARRASFNPDARAMVTVAVLAVALQMAAVYWAYFRLGNGGQGRYLFPVLVPSLLLFWFAIEGWVPRARRVRAAAALVTLFGVLDVVAWTAVAIPAYYNSL